MRDELDPGVLMWFIHRHFTAADLAQRVVIQRNLPIFDA